MDVGSGKCRDSGHTGAWDDRDWFRCSVCDARSAYPVMEFWDASLGRLVVRTERFRFCPSCGREISNGR